VASLVAARAATVPGVVRLDAGPFGTKSTYGAGGRVDGVTVRTGSEPPSVTVHIAVRLGERIPELAECVSQAVGAVLEAELGDAGPWAVGVDVVDVVATGGTFDAARPRRELL
jgi:uncharacterized alkaline shock family protein YloU